MDSLLSLEDVEHIVNAVASIGDPSIGTPLADRKRMLLAGVKAMIDFVTRRLWTLGVAFDRH